MPSTPLIETERLRLRAVTEGDLDELVRLHQDPLVARFMGSPDREWLARWLRWSDEEWEERGHGRLAIVEKESGRFLGRTGLDWASGRFDVPYFTAMIRPDKLLGDPVTVWALSLSS